MSFVRIASIVLCVIHISCYNERFVKNPEHVLSKDSEEDKSMSKNEELDKTVSLMESREILPSKDLLDQVRRDIVATELRDIPDEPILCQEYDYSDWFHSSNVEQGSVGSCTIFSCLGIIEAISYRESGKHFDLSERDLFFQQYFGNSGVEEDAIEGLVWRSRSSRTGEAATYDEVFKLALNNGVCLEKERPYNEEYWMNEIDLLKYNIEKMFYFIREQMAMDGKHSHEIARERKDELRKILLKGGEFRRLFKAESAVSETCKEQRENIKELLSNYRAAYIDLVNIQGHEEKGRAILEALSHGPVAGVFGGTPGHAFVIYKCDCQDGKLRQLYIRDSDRGNWNTTMQQLDEEYTFWKIFIAG